jgi:DNA-binding transcriptional ArsR family regulator
MEKRSKGHVIRSTAQLRALASAPRQEIVDVLSRMGAVTVAELAATLGRPADALYYHLRVLVRVGLVFSVEPGNKKGRREASFRTVAPELHLEYSSTDQSRVRSTSAIVSSMLRLGIRDFRRSLAAGTAQLAGPRRELWALRATGWLTPDEIEQVNGKMQSLRDAVWKPKGKGRLYGITILLTPLDQRARKSRKATTKKKRRKS